MNILTFKTETRSSSVIIQCAKKQWMFINCTVKCRGTLKCSKVAKSSPIDTTHRSMFERKGNFQNNDGKKSHAPPKWKELFDRLPCCYPRISTFVFLAILYFWFFIFKNKNVFRGRRTGLTPPLAANDR